MAVGWAIADKPNPVRVARVNQSVFMASLAWIGGGAIWVGRKRGVSDRCHVTDCVFLVGLPGALEVLGKAWVLRCGFRETKFGSVGVHGTLIVRSSWFDGPIPPAKNGSFYDCARNTVGTMVELCLTRPTAWPFSTAVSEGEAALLSAERDEAEDDSTWLRIGERAAAVVWCCFVAVLAPWSRSTPARVALACLWIVGFFWTLIF